MSAGGLNLRASGRSRRRLLKSRLFELVAILAAAAAIGVLGLLVGEVVVKAWSALNLDLITNNAATFGQTGGGIAPAIVGSIILVLIATAIAVPLGVLTAIYVSEFASRRIGDQVRLGLDILNGFPSIIFGLFVYVLLVKTKLSIFGIVSVGNHQSGWAGGIALSIIMLPLVARTTMEVLRLVPDELRQASYGLGVSKWRTVIGVVLPSALGGILTGTTLAIARAAGETAPLLFVCAAGNEVMNTDPSKPLASLPFTIFSYAESGTPDLEAQAWAAAFILIAFVLITSLTSRLLLDRWRRKLGHTQ